jgi:putative FmdB family regulatory protein
MPIYEYRCKACGHTLEAIQKLADKPLTKCPECSGSSRSSSRAPAFQLKGAAGTPRGTARGGSSSSSVVVRIFGEVVLGLGREEEGRRRGLRLRLLRLPLIRR